MNIFCPHCRNEIEVSDDTSVGQHIKCPHCNEKFYLEDGSCSCYTIECPYCQNECSCDTEPTIGQNLICPFCGSEFKYRGASSSQSVTTESHDDVRHRKNSTDAIWTQYAGMALSFLVTMTKTAYRKGNDLMDKCPPLQKRPMKILAWSLIVILSFFFLRGCVGGSASNPSKRVWSIDRIKSSTSVHAKEGSIRDSAVDYRGEERIKRENNARLEREAQRKKEQEERKHAKEDSIRDSIVDYRGEERIKRENNARLEREVQRKKEQEERKHAKAAAKEKAKRERPRTLEEMPVEQRMRIGSFQGFSLGTTDDTIPSVDMRAPTGIRRHVKMKTPFDVFTNVEMTLVYTPVTRKLAGIALIQTNDVVGVDCDKEVRRVEGVAKELYDAKYYKLPTAQIDSEEFKFSKYGGVSGFCVDGKIFSMNYEDRVYSLYIADTNLVADITKEILQAQTEAIHKETILGTTELPSFCGVQFGDIARGAGWVSTCVKIDPQTGKGLGQTDGKNVRCNKFRFFSEQATAFTSYKTDSIFRVDMELSRGMRITTEGGIDGELRTILSMLEEKYSVKPYLLYPQSTYRLSSYCWPAHIEYLFPLKNAEIHVIVDDRSPLKIIAISHKYADIALEEFDAWRDERALIGIDVLSRPGAQISPVAKGIKFKPGTLKSFMGYTFGQTNGVWLTGVSENHGYRFGNAKVYPAFRHMLGYRVLATHRTGLVYEISCLMVSGNQGSEFTFSEEIENINKVLKKYLKVDACETKTEHKHIWTYSVGDVVVELIRDGGELSLKARNLVLEKLSNDEFSATRRKEEAARPGVSAL